MHLMNLNSPQMFVDFLTIQMIPLSMAKDLYKYMNIMSHVFWGAFSRKFAYVDFNTEEDFTKALELDRVKILDQKIRLGKANVKDVTAEEKKGTSLILREFSMLLLYYTFLELID